MTESDLITQVTREIRGLSSNFIADDFTDAVDAAQRDTGFTLPTTVDFQIKWLIERTKRALYFGLCSENAESFKFKQMSLNQKFDNFYKLIAFMDAAFDKAIAENPTEFAGGEPYELFGSKVDAGFSYDDLGEDTTYDEENIVQVTPGD